MGTNVGIYVGIVGIILGILNVIFIQSLNTLNSYFLFFEAISVIGMSLFAFFRMLLKDEALNLYRYSHFWFISIMMFFWSITFLYWGLFDYLNEKLKQEAWKITLLEFVVAIITYTSIGLIFLLYPKLKNNNG